MRAAGFLKQFRRMCNPRVFYLVFRQEGESPQ
jgi:hypothetical protein